MRAEPTSSAGFGGVGPAGMNADARRLELAHDARELGLAGEEVREAAVVRRRRGARWQLGLPEVDVDQQHARAGLGERRGEVQRAHGLALARRRRW